MPGSELVQSTLHACDLLGELAGRDGVRLLELSETLGLKAPRIHNLLRTLAARGYAAQDSSGRWRLGATPRDLVEKDYGRHLLSRAAEQFRAFRDDFPQVILVLAEIRADRVEIVLRASPDRPGVIQYPQDFHVPPFGSAVGLVCMAFSDSLTALQLRESHPFEEAAAPLWPDRETLDAFLEKAREDGFLATPFKKQEVVRIAAPVLDSAGRFRAALGAALPVDDSDIAKRKRLESRVVAGAKALTWGPG